MKQSVGLRVGASLSEKWRPPDLTGVVSLLNHYALGNENITGLSDIGRDHTPGEIYNMNRHYLTDSTSTMEAQHVGPETKWKDRSR